MSDKKYVTYEEFGAVGDGVTEDFAAIYKAHEYANANGLSVKARDDAHYYIHDPRVDGVISQISVRTDVNWGKARFTIDDRDISVFKGSDTYDWHGKAIFNIEPDHPKETVTDEEILLAVVKSGLKPGATKLPLKFDYPVMIIPYNTSHNVYRRRGYGGWAGSPMHEVIVLDKDGNIDPETPIMFNYESLDYIDVYRIDDKPITVEGGEFTTRSTNVNTVYTNSSGEKTFVGGYIFRGLNICRSNTLVKGVKHYITDEPTLRQQVDEKTGEIILIAACYRGFFSPTNANHITIKDCVLTGRRCYKRPVGGTGGTYDLSGNCVNKIVFDGCTQTNFWVKVDENYNITPAKEGEPGAVTSMNSYTIDGTTVKMHWGIGGTNFCKNMEYHNSTLSRFDAHMGLYNGKIKNCTVNYMAITGNGKFEVENTRWFAEGAGYGSNSLLHLRADYGSTWDGEISIKNVKAYVHTENRTYTFYHSFNNWYYGYIAHFPNISIDNLSYYDIATFKKLDPGFEVHVAGASILNEPALHLPETVNTHPSFADEDKDGDGFIDGTKIPYTGVVNRRGVVDESQNVNLNPIARPDYYKVSNNEGGYKYVVIDTAKQNLPEGGFFGKTVFSHDGKEFVGTEHNGDTGCFRFASPEELVQ